MTTTPDQTSLSFTDALDASAQSAGRKTERTRHRLLASMAGQLMNGVDRRDLKVANVTKNAGLAHGTFYRYFTDTRQAMDVLVEEFAQFVRAGLSSAREGEPGTPARVRASMSVYVHLYANNAPLMRCLVDLGAETSTFSASYQKLNRIWYERMAKAMEKHRAEGSEKAGTAQCNSLVTAYALGGMVDDFLAQVFLRKEPALASLAKNPETIAELLTTLWLKGAYGSLPDSND